MAVVVVAALRVVLVRQWNRYNRDEDDGDVQKRERHMNADMEKDLIKKCLFSICG